jgi:hypothetical protein
MEPLPEAFSPHRRGQKFVAGGMAAEVRQWVLDAAQVSAHQKRSAYGDDMWRVRVMESIGAANEGVVLVKGTVEGREVRMMLPGAGKSKHVGTITVGMSVGIKPPTWEVPLDGEMWVVAADWQVLRDNG